MTTNVKSVCFVSNIICYTMRFIAPIKLYTVNDQLNLGLLRLMSSTKINTSVKIGNLFIRKQLIYDCKSQKLRYNFVINYGQ